MDKFFQNQDIENKIREAEEKKKTAVILMVASLFFLWPLMIVGAIMHDRACKEIHRLNEEKNRIMYEEYLKELNGEMQS